MSERVNGRSDDGTLLSNVARPVRAICYRQDGADDGSPPRFAMPPHRVLRLAHIPEPGAQRLIVIRHEMSLQALSLG